MKNIAGKNGYLTKTRYEVVYICGNEVIIGVNLKTKKKIEK